MNIFSKIYCRTYQRVLKIAIRFMKIRTPVVANFEDLANILDANKIEKVLIMTIPFVTELSQYKDFIRALEKRRIAYNVFDRIDAEPTSILTDETTKIYISSGSKGIVAIGGGSVIDCAKIAGATVATGKTPRAMQGMLKVRRKLPFLAAAPTTAGTGSEATLAAVVTDSESGRKASIMDMPLVPDMAILEPALTEGMPPALTAYTGLDALTHAVEAYIGYGGTGRTDKLAENAVKLIAQNLEKAYKDGHDLVIRKNMLVASFDAGCAFTRAFVGYVHAIGHALGAKYHIPHGHAMAVILPVVLEFYGATVNKKLARLARAAGISNSKNAADAAGDFKIWLKKLNHSLEIPERFSQINKNDIPELALAAAKEGNPNYPVPKLFNAKELEKIIESLMS